jgi:hypothetical protein
VLHGTPTFQTALAPSTANLAQPLAVAMGANVAGQYGWYQISGQAVVATNGTLAAGRLRSISPALVRSPPPVRPASRC